MGSSPKDGTERFILLGTDIDEETAHAAMLVLAGVAAETNDTCGLRNALEALGLIERKTDDVDE